MTLTAADRCDRCGAQAYVRAVLKAGSLDFCQHHWREHGDALGECVVVDETERLATDAQR